MATKKSKSEEAILEQYRIALENAETHHQTSNLISELGYGPEKMAEGKAVWSETRQAYDTNKTEDDETSEVYDRLEELIEQLNKKYSLHRKKAKAVFLDDPVTAEKLAITGTMPQAYISWLETVRKFYTTALVDTTIQSKLAQLKVSIDDLESGNTLVKDVESARADYLVEIGESQDATKIKDSAFDKLEKWMRRFYAVTKIALEDHPQLLEALGKKVKS